MFDDGHRVEECVRPSVELMAKAFDPHSVGNVVELLDAVAFLQADQTHAGNTRKPFKLRKRKRPPCIDRSRIPGDGDLEAIRSDRLGPSLKSVRLRVKVRTLIGHRVDVRPECEGQTQQGTMKAELQRTVVDIDDLAIIFHFPHQRLQLSLRREQHFGAALRKQRQVAAKL